MVKGYIIGDALIIEVTYNELFEQIIGADVYSKTFYTFKKI